MSPPKYIELPHVEGDVKDSEGRSILNRYSHFMTRGHDYPAAQVCSFSLLLSTIVTDGNTGHVVRSRGSGSTCHEDLSTSWRGVMLVGR